MAINGIGSSSTYGSIAPTKSKSSEYDSKIKALQQQRKLIQKQIDEIKASKQSDELKQEQLKPLQQQITQIQAEIQQDQLDKAKESSEGDSSASSTSGSSASVSGDRDSVQINGASSVGMLKMMNSYNKFGKLVSLSNSLKNKGAVMQSDAKIIAGNGNGTVAAKLDAQGSAFSADATNILTSAAKEAAKANKAGKDANKAAAKSVLDKGVFTDTIKTDKSDSNDKTNSVDDTQSTQKSSSDQ